MRWFPPSSPLKIPGKTKRYQCDPSIPYPDLEPTLNDMNGFVYSQQHEEDEATRFKQRIFAYPEDSFGYYRMHPREEGNVHQQNGNDLNPLTEEFFGFDSSDVKPTEQWSAHQSFNHNEKWDHKVHELVAYQEKKFGYSANNVPHLERNVSDIDLLSEKSNLDENKQETQEKWGTQGIKNQEKWDNRFKQLLSFKKKYGHCKIPNNQKEYRSLRNWLGKQREAYKTYQTSGQGVPNASKRIKKLQMIGVSLEPYSTNWNTKFQELILFQREYGHCIVPQQGKSKHTRLGQWLGRQKKDLRPSWEMVNSNLSFTPRDLERARLLESLEVYLGDE